MAMNNIIPLFGSATEKHTIVAADGTLQLNDVGADTDSTSVDVTPDTMSTTSVKVDTGDGTDWFKISSGSTATGDFTLEVTLLSYPTVNKTAKVTISDDAGEAADEDVTVQYIHS